MKYYLIVSVLLLASSAAKNSSDDDLPINKFQVIGSHNSYKKAIDPALFALIKSRDSLLAKGIEYSHISLSDQLTLGLRNLEIDIYADSKGGKYQKPIGLEWTGSEATPFDTDGVMNEPGFKVFHIQEIDFRSSCPTFKKCLQELKAWSDHNKDHFPVFITINAKDEAINRPGFTTPEKFTTEIYDEVDKSILENLGKNKVLTPDDIRGHSKTLEDAVRKGQWPSFTKAKGKFVFILDESAGKVAQYVQGHPSLKNRAMFVNTPSGNPEAAIVILNDPISDSLKIRNLVNEGYIVRTRADADTKEARLNDRRRFEVACRSGAQIITTDYYAKSTHFKSDYIISFENKKYHRRNPVIL